VRFGESPESTTTGLQLLETVLQLDPTFYYTTINYGIGPLVDTMSYTDPKTQIAYSAPPIPNPSGIFCSYWTSDNVGQTWNLWMSSCDARIIHNGDVDGWLAQPFGDEWDPDLWPVVWAKPVVPRLLAGDADGSETVDVSDLNIVLSNYNHSGVDWSHGDFNGDGLCNIDDLNNVLSNYNHSSNVSTSIPEPSTFVLIAVGALAAIVWRRWVA
jgi:hypothetical protein